MAKRYKLVPESLYKRFLQPDDISTKVKPDEVFRQTIPDDLKVLLYADAARDVQVKQQRKRSTPIYVKTIDETSKPIAEDRMPKLLNNAKAVAIHDFLQKNGVTYNDNMEIVINGKPISNSVYPLMIKGLQNRGIGYQIGMKEVIDALPSLPPDVSKSILKQSKTKSKTQTGSGWISLN